MNAETFEERVAALGGTIELLTIRMQFNPDVLWNQIPGWVIMGEADSGPGLLIAFDERAAPGEFATNVTAALWRISVQRDNITATDLTGGTIVGGECAGASRIHRHSRPILSRYLGAVRLFHDEFRIDATGQVIESFAQLEVAPCASSASTFHALQRTNTQLRDTHSTIPQRKALDLASFCALTCWE